MSASEAGSGSDADDLSEIEDADLLEAHGSIEPEVSPLCYGFVVVHTSKKLRRLHYVGSCGKRPNEHYKQFDVYGDEMPEASKYDRRCIDCFPEEKRLEEASENDGSMSSSSSTCSSSASLPKAS